MGLSVLVINICLTLLHNNNKVTYKTLLGLGEFYQLIQPLKQGHDTREPEHYLQVTKQFQIVSTWLTMPTS
jgi:uncharacterized protein YjbK